MSVRDDEHDLYSQTYSRFDLIETNIDLSVVSMPSKFPENQGSNWPASLCWTYADHIESSGDLWRFGKSFYFVSAAVGVC